MAPALARSGSIAKAGNNLRLVEKRWQSLILITWPSCEKSEKAKYVRPATVTSKPWREKFFRQIGTHLVVDHSPGALVVPLVDCLVGIHQLHLHLLHHSSTKAAVYSTVPAPLRLVKSPFADNILESDEKGIESTWNEQFAGVSAWLPTTRKRMEINILTPIADWCGQRSKQDEASCWLCKQFVTLSTRSGLTTEELMFSFQIYCIMIQHIYRHICTTENAS